MSLTVNHVAVIVRYFTSIHISNSIITISSTTTITIHLRTQGQHSFLCRVFLSVDSWSMFSCVVTVDKCCGGEASLREHIGSRSSIIKTV